MNGSYYILVDREPVAMSDFKEWTARFKPSDRFVGQTKTDSGLVSTIFLGLDHRTTEDKPVLFESMVFGGPLDGQLVRYQTWRDAELGHKALVIKLRGLNA